MVVLSEERPGEAFPPERLSSTRRELQLRYGMPIDWRPVEVSASLPACRAVVATRLHAPDREAALLRRLRVLQFSALDIDDPAVIERAASEALIEPAELRAWMADPEVEPVARGRQARLPQPSPASRAQDYKLGGPEEERRYTCPSYELIRVTEPPVDWPTASRVDLPGYRPVEAYETALANIAPELVRRPDPESVEEVLAWAGDADRHRRGRRRLRSRGRRRAGRARARRHVPAGRRRRLLDRRRLSRAVLGPC